MAFWGAPTPQSDHAERCCRSALACCRAIEAAELVDDQGNRLQIRIGINSGRMVVGNVGSELRLNYTVIGDAVNVASRLEGANKSYGTRILIGQATYSLVERTMLTREVDTIAVYGREEGLTVYELVQARDRLTEEKTHSWIARYEEALERYRSGDFNAACFGFEEVLQHRPHDGPAEVMRLRCIELARVGSADSWRPLTALTSK